MTQPGSRHIAVIGVSHPYRGGIAHYSTLFVRTLRQKHRVSFINFTRQYPKLLFPGKTQLDDSSEPMLEPNERCVDSLNPVSWLRTAAMLNQRAPDLIVIQWWHPFFAPAFGTIVRRLNPALRSRVVFLCHNVLPHEASPMQKALTRFAFGDARYFIVHSEEDSRRLQALRPAAIIAKGHHPTYAELGTGKPHTKQEARRALGISEERKTLLFFGLIRPYKGLRHLIEAMRRVSAELDCQLVVAGEFYEDKRPYLELIEKLALGQKIHVVDRYIPNEDVALFFTAADVVVLPYVSATQSGIVQIAFGLERPVISTNVGGLPEAVDHGKTGLLVEPQDPERLAAAILEYFRLEMEPRFAAEIRRQKGRFDWSQALDHVDEFLRRSAAA
ncbi:MAG: glycosyltransferase [Woeseiaceae bacterium]